MNHVPNQQAVATLVTEVLPRVLQLLPDDLSNEFVVHIVGSNETPDWLLTLMLNSSHIKFHGALSDDEVQHQTCVFRRADW